MAVDLFGPADAGAALTLPARPPRARDAILQDSWHKGCEGGPGTGTPVMEDWLNQQVAILRSLVRKNRGVESNADDHILTRVMRQRRANYCAAEASVVGVTLVLALDPAPSGWDELLGADLRVFMPAGAAGCLMVGVQGLPGAAALKTWGGHAPARKDMRAGAIRTLTYDGTSVQMLGLSPSDLLAALAGPMDYYVDASSGDDSHDGESQASAFRTISGARAAILARNMGFSQVTLHVAPGTYGGALFMASSIPSWRLQLAPGALIDSTSLSTNFGRGVLVYSGADVVVSGGKIRAAYEAAAASGGSLSLDGVAVDMSTMAGVGTVCAYAGARVSVGGAMLVSGAGAILFAADNASVQLGYQDAVGSTPLALQFAAGATFGSAGVVATNAGNVRVASAVLTSAGAPTGRKYLSNLNGVINTNGAGVNFLPGSAAGVSDTATGGQYV